MERTITNQAPTSSVVDTASVPPIHPHPREYDIHHPTYTVEEVAGLLGRSPDMILHAVLAGELAAYRVGQDIVYIKRAALLDWLKLEEELR